MVLRAKYPVAQCHLYLSSQHLVLSGQLELHGIAAQAILQSEPARLGCVVVAADIQLAALRHGRVGAGHRPPSGIPVRPAEQADFRKGQPPNVGLLLQFTGGSVLSEFIRLHKTAGQSPAVQARMIAPAHHQQFRAAALQRDHHQIHRHAGVRVVLGMVGRQELLQRLAIPVAKQSFLHRITPLSTLKLP